jgi:UDP-N-acetylglucosamine/UDP-N-acetylgalactosamine 4-epimerase
VSFFFSMELKNRTLLVTGGGGFIGSNLCEALLQSGNKVICLDNFSTGKKENLSAFSENKNFILIEGDIRDQNTCASAMKDVEIVFHQAALGSVPRSINDPVTTNEVNISGFLNVITSARDAKVKRFIYAGSSSTYGDSAELPKREEKIGNPLSPYAVTKYVNELYAGVFSSLYKMEIIGLRYFNVFGKHQDPEGQYAAAIPKFIRLLMNGESPVVFGDGMQSRDFTYVKNVIQANLLAATATDEKALNTVYNVACGDRTTLLDLITTLKDLIDEHKPGTKNIEIKFTSERAGEVKHSLASIDKAKTLLGYQPHYNLKRGLEEALVWYLSEGVISDR